jgi:Tfp pilus assembly protein PilF
VPHEISGWEGIFAAFGKLRNGDEDEGRKEMAAAIAGRPDAWQGYFNAACFEALTGSRGAAFEYLRRAIDLDPKAAELAQEDSDFDSLRDDPEFPA